MCHMAFSVVVASVFFVVSPAVTDRQRHFNHSFLCKPMAIR
ncbi:hypothetical protein O59_003360 [Cellvibrio sp. BR]|nr:hypothetical protein O59_003360 [Cellvibrio sp. BR]